MVEELDRRVRSVFEEYELGFYVRLVTLAGDEVRDERGAPVGVLFTTYVRGFDRVWSDLYSKTGGRLRKLVHGHLVVDESSKDRTRWSRVLSRSEASACGDESPFVLRVLLRGFW